MASSVHQELCLLAAEEEAYKRQLALPVVMYQNQTYPLRSETGTPGVTALYPSSNFNSGMAPFTDAAEQPIFVEQKARPFLAKAALEEFTQSLDLSGVAFDIALRAYLNAFDLSTWLEPTKMCVCLEIFVERYCACNHNPAAADQAWAAWQPLCQKLALEVIQLHGGDGGGGSSSGHKPSHHEFIAAVGASENGNPTQVQMACYIRGVYERICSLRARGVGIKDDDESWDLGYSMGAFGTEQCDEHGLLLRTQIELLKNGHQLLETGWEWQKNSAWKVDATATTRECDKDGWSYAADWESCFYAQQDDVIWREAEQNGRQCTQVVRRRRWVRSQESAPVAGDDVSLSHAVATTLRDAFFNDKDAHTLRRLDSRAKQLVPSSTLQVADGDAAAAGARRGNGAERGGGGGVGRNNVDCGEWRSLQDMEIYRKILRSGALWEPFCRIEAEVLYYYRRRLCKLPALLPKLLKCIDWQQQRQVDAALKCLSSFCADIPANIAVSLLDADQPHTPVRLFAIHALCAIPDDRLLDNFLQIVQTLKYELNHDNPVARFCLNRALQSQVVGQHFFWALRAELHDPRLTERFGLLLEEFVLGLRCATAPLCAVTPLLALRGEICSALADVYVCGCRYRDFERLSRESHVMSLLRSLAERVKAHDTRSGAAGEDAAKAQTVFLRAELERLTNGRYKVFPDTFSLPLDPFFSSSGFAIDKCKVMGSAQKPVWLELLNADPHGQPSKVIFKTGDDLRQDILTLQMIKIIDRLWKVS